jgi:glutaredoxin 3|tara:strand:+ start:388 stop:636 length:249 start_codon:yes stop_codon:yes gene_type:complete
MKVEIYSKPQCPYCVQAKALAERKGYNVIYKMLDEDFDREALMETFPGARTFPQIIVDGEKIGGFTEFKALVDTYGHEVDGS